MGGLDANQYIIVSQKVVSFGRSAIIPLTVNRGL